MKIFVLLLLGCEAVAFGQDAAEKTYVNKSSYKLSYANCWTLTAAPDALVKKLDETADLQFNRTPKCVNSTELAAAEYLIVSKFTFIEKGQDPNVEQRKKFQLDSKDEIAIFYRKFDGKNPSRLQVLLMGTGNVRWEYRKFCKSMTVDLKFGFGGNDTKKHIELKNKIKNGNPSIPSDIQKIIDSIECL